MSRLFARQIERLDEMLPVCITGRVRQIIGLVIECDGLSVPVGSLCKVHPASGTAPIKAEVVGFKGERALLMPLGEMRGLRPHDPVECISSMQEVPVGQGLLGRVIDTDGNPIDDKGPLFALERNPIYADPPHPLGRPRITDPLATGVRSIDGLNTLGSGQRVGLFAGSGVGKSVLLGMISRYTSADINVIALIGERGREVREFIERDLGEEGLSRSVVVVETSDRPALCRVKAAFTACAVAEYFRDQGRDVLLLMDSLTRMANAQREIGLSAGEPPTTKGYPPSVFAQMPRLLERAGQSEAGSITGIYTVLVEGDDINEPIADAARSILDGHIWLSRDLAHRGHYPAIDILGSISRLMLEVSDEQHRASATMVRRLLAAYREAEDLINIGAYVRGSNPDIDLAIALHEALMMFVRQGVNESSSFGDTVDALNQIGRKADELDAQRRASAAGGNA